MLKSTKASKEEEMSEYDRERRLVREREGIEFATDVRGGSSGIHVRKFGHGA